MFYSFEKPASAQMFIESVIKIIEFHTLSPEPLIQLWDEDFKLDLFLQKHTSKGSWISQNYIFVLIFLMVVASIIILGMIAIVGFRRE